MIQPPLIHSGSGNIRKLHKGTRLLKDVWIKKNNETAMSWFVQKVSKKKAPQLE